MLAAYLLATAAFHGGQWSQAFPSFGAERRGAPIAAFVRIDDHPILRRSQVTTPRFLILQDDGLLHIPATLSGISPDGAILVNSPASAAALRSRMAKEGTPVADALRLVSIPAGQLATAILGRPIPNTALLAAFLALTGILPLETLDQALSERFSGELLTKNLHMAEAGSTTVEAGQWKETAHA